MTSVGMVMVSVAGEPVSAPDRLGFTASGVQVITFAASAWNRLAAVVARVSIVGLAVAVILGVGARDGISGGFVAVAALLGHILWVSARPGWRVAWRVIVSDQYVEGTGYGGRRVRLTWDHVGVQRFVRRSSRAPSRVLSLGSIDRQREIIFDDRLPGFEQLVAMVETKARRVSDGPPNS